MHAKPESELSEKTEDQDRGGEDDEDKYTNPATNPWIKTD